MLKSRSETLLRGTASLTLIEKSVHKQGLVSINLQGEMYGRNFTSVNRIQSPASPPNTSRASFLHAGSSLLGRKLMAGHSRGPGRGLRHRGRRKSCSGDMAGVCEITITAERRKG